MLTHTVVRLCVWGGEGAGSKNLHRWSPESEKWIFLPCNHVPTSSLTLAIIKVVTPGPGEAHRGDLAGLRLNRM